MDITNIQDLVFQLTATNTTTQLFSKPTQPTTQPTKSNTCLKKPGGPSNWLDNVAKSTPPISKEACSEHVSTDGHLMTPATLADQSFPLPLHEMKNIQQCLFRTNQYMDNIYRYGTLHENGKQNISLYYSLLFCLKRDFMLLTKSEQLSTINKFKHKIYTDLTNEKLYIIHQYNQYGWTKNDIQKDIYESNNSPIVLQYLADYFNINIFILNHTTNKLNVYYTEDKLVVFKMNLILAYKRIAWKEYFEPIIGSNKKTKKKYYLFNHTNNNLVNLMSNAKTVECVSVHKSKRKKAKTFEVCHDINAIIKQVIASKKDNTFEVHQCHQCLEKSPTHLRSINGIIFILASIKSFMILLWNFLYL